MEIEFKDALLMGYPVLCTVIAALYRENKATKEEYIKSLIAAKQAHNKSVSDMEDRLAELENGNIE